MYLEITQFCLGGGRNRALESAVTGNTRIHIQINQKINEIVSGHRKVREHGNVGPRKNSKMAENFVEDFKLSLICKKVCFLSHMISFYNT